MQKQYSSKISSLHLLLIPYLIFFQVYRHYKFNNQHLYKDSNKHLILSNNNLKSKYNNPLYSVGFNNNHSKMFPFKLSNNYLVTLDFLCKISSHKINLDLLILQIIIQHKLLNNNKIKHLLICLVI